MPTQYTDREDEHDLGNGHSFMWMRDSTDTVFGLIEHHLPSPENAAKGHLYCGGYIAWAAPSDGSPCAVKHSLVSGSPGDETTLTVTPSLACRNCSSHGWIRDGLWVPA